VNQAFIAGVYYGRRALVQASCGFKKEKGFSKIIGFAGIQE